MNKIWTPMFQPPLPRDVSDLSYSALKIISYFEHEGRCKASLSYENISKEQKCNVELFQNILRPPILKYDNFITPKCIPSSSKNKAIMALPECNDLNYSVDMFEDFVNMDGKNHTILANTSVNIKEDNTDKRVSEEQNSKITNYFTVTKSDAKFQIKKNNKRNVFTDEIIRTPFKIEGSEINQDILKNPKSFKLNLSFGTNEINNKQLGNGSYEGDRICSQSHFKTENPVKTKKCEYKFLTNSNSMSQVRKLVHPAGDIDSKIMITQETTRVSNTKIYNSTTKDDESIHKVERKLKTQRPKHLKANSKTRISENSKSRGYQTKIDSYVQNGSKNTSWNIINLHNSENIIKDLINNKFIEVGFTICYRERFCLLNKPDSKTKKSSVPSGIILYFKYDNNDSEMAFFEMKFFKELQLREMLLLILNSFTRKICYEAQALILYIIDNIEETDKRICHDWNILDPLIGFWMLNPDQPPKTFEDILTLCQIDKKITKTDWKFVCCQYMIYQSQVMECLYTQLVKHSLWNVFFHLEIKMTSLLAGTFKFRSSTSTIRLFIPPFSVTIQVYFYNLLNCFVPIIIIGFEFNPTSAESVANYSIMETTSILIDKNKLFNMGTIIAEQLKYLEEKANEIVGHKFQLSSHLQLRGILYDELQLDKRKGISVKETGTGVKSTAESVLKSLENIHPLPKLVLEYRQLSKIKSTYIDGILQHLDENNEIITSWEQSSTATGRLTSNNPNLQAIPKYTIALESKKINLRSCYKARPGNIFIAADFQQIEFRVFAYLAQERNLLLAFNEKGDIFNRLTQLRLKTDNFSKEERDRTKTLIYAFIYGAGSNKLADILSVDSNTASRIAQGFLESFPSFRNYREKILDEVRRHQELKSISGRRRLFPHINSSNQKLRMHTERQAMNFIIQGSAADICKNSMIITEQKLKEKKLHSKLIMQIHDELVWEVDCNQMRDALVIIKESMETKHYLWSQTSQMNIPLPVSISTGLNWGEMTSV